MYFYNRFKVNSQYLPEGKKQTNKQTSKQTKQKTKQKAYLNNNHALTLNQTLQAASTDLNRIVCL